MTFDEETIARAAELIWIVLKQFDDADRVRVLGEVEAHCCRSCGRDLRDGEVCHCENDT